MNETDGLNQVLGGVHTPGAFVATLADNHERYNAYDLSYWVICFNTAILSVKALTSLSIG